MKRFIPRIALLPLYALLCQACNTSYVDLGLPSGTLWKATDEKGGFYTYDDAVSKYGSQLPTESQFQELIDYCTWTWTGHGCRVVGPNGKSITFRAKGHKGTARGSFSGFHGGLYNVGRCGCYWSSTLNEWIKGDALALIFGPTSEWLRVTTDDRRCGFSVRLVK